MILIIGYGNPLRSDDAIGQLIAQEMSQRLKPLEVQVLIANQLMPELVEPMSGARLVIFIDARMGTAPGEITHETVAPYEGTGAFTHNVTPASLMAGVRELYGKAPRGILISIIGAEFGYGCDLSPQLQQKLPAIADQVKAIIESSVNVQIYEETDYA